MNAANMAFNEDSLGSQLNESLIEQLSISGEHKKVLLQCLSESDTEHLESLAYGMMEEKGLRSLNESFYNFFGEGNNNRENYKAIKCEFYRFLCTTHGAYGRERDELGKGLKTIIPLLATSIAASLGLAIPLGVVIGVIAAFFMLALKIGKNAWCSANSNVCIR